MSVLTLNVDEIMRTLTAESSNPFVVHDKEVDVVRFAINSGFADIVLDGQVALRVMYQRPRETEVRAQTLTYYDTDGLHNYYDWQLSQSDLAKNGALMVALCILDISGGEVSEWHTTPCAVRVLSTIHTDDSDEGDDTITPTVKERVAVLETMIQRVASGAPIVVASTSAMTDTSQIYVLSTDGNWYYHNGSAWVAGGEYGAVATDTTLTQSGVPADAKAVGDALASGGGGSGITAQEKALILSLFRNASYTSDVSAIYATLYDLWNDSPEPTPTTGLIHRWDLTQSLVDNVGGLTASVGTGGSATPTQTETGVVFVGSGEWLDFGAVYWLDRTYELDIANMAGNFATSQRQRIFCADDAVDHNATGGAACLIGGTPTGASNWGWSVYRGAAWGSVLTNVGEEAAEKKLFFSGRTVKIYVSSDHKWTVKSKPIGGSAWVTHVVNESVSPTNWGVAGKTFHVQIGSTGSTDNCQGLTVSGLRVYEGEV